MTGELPLGKIAEDLIKQIQEMKDKANADLKAYDGAIEGIKALVVKVQQHVDQATSISTEETKQNG